MRRTMLVVAALMLLQFPSSRQVGAAVGTALTVGAVRAALLDSIQRLDSAIQSAAQSVKGVGNSLEANARGVVSDIDTRLGAKLDYTFDRLDATEKRFMEDAQALVGQIDTAAVGIVTLTEGAARRVLGDADIVAYNALYSLPCRDQIPRVVYSTPDVVYEGYTVPEVTVHGNFLDLGSEPDVTVDGQTARLVARSANQLHVALPKVVSQNVAAPHSVAVRFRPTRRDRSCYLFGLIPWSSERPLANDLSSSVLLQPKTTVSLTSTLTPVLAQRETGTWGFGDRRGTDGNCDAHFDATLTFCIPDAWGGRLVAGNPYSGPGVNSKNCTSDIEGVDVIGDRCVRVRAHIGGCGYDHLPFGINNCKGNGWLDYGITLNGERMVPTNGAEAQVVAEGVVPVQTNFVVPYSGDLQGQTPSAWHYRATVSFHRGDPNAPIRKVEITDTDPVVGGITSRLDNGTLAIDLAQAVAGLFPTVP